MRPYCYFGVLPLTTPPMMHLNTLTGPDLYIACVAWRFLSDLRAIGKWESRDKERRSREEPGRETTETTEKPPPLCVFAFKLPKPPSYAG